jgi:protein-tyrosine phosphatase
VDEVAALGLHVPLVARRLMLRAWPGSLVLEVPAAVGLPATSIGLARLRCPDHKLFDLVTPAVADMGPLLVADTGLTSAADAVAQLGDVVEFAVNAGERPLRSQTVVRTTAGGFTVIEPGSIPPGEIERLAARIVLFVCTGNTCRSPLAEGLAKKALADRLGCTVDELPARGFWFLSAGVAAYGGGPASPESVAVAAEFGADLKGHRSRPVNPQLLMAADDVIAMTESHLHALAAYDHGMATSAQLLCGNEDLDDPIGADEGVYRACALTILRQLDRFLAEWVRS